MKKLLSIVMALLFLLTQTFVYAEGLKEGAASLILPTTGQAMNNESGSTKTKIMAGVEAAAITTVAVLGVASGGGVVWFGLGPLIVNHLWSATDAYKGAKQKENPLYQQQIIEAQRTIELSRMRRLNNHTEAPQADIRRRIQTVGEQAY